MRKRTVLGFWLLLVALTVALVSATPLRASGGEPPDIIEFETMFPVMGPWLGVANPIRGVNGGGLPWAIDRAEGELQTNGSLKVEVRGLVLADHPMVPEALRLTNPVAEFRALLSCISHDMEGHPTVVNVSTDPFPATPEGDAKIEAMVELPHPCLAPIIFVMTPTGRWLAVTGDMGM
ncbi:MAG: hypothetical protein HY683_06105 [Chloroflexi bacterium]|nr:hypothetical protein [Chloroflexota bacterium]